MDTPSPLVPMKPIMIVPPDTISPEDMQALRDNGLCIVVSKDPASVKFLDPIPAVSSRTAVENAAIMLSRKIMTKGFWNTSDVRKEVCAAYVDLLIAGTPLDPAPSQQEREREIFNQAKVDELRRLAREEAKAERAVQKAQKATKETPKQ